MKKTVVVTGASGNIGQSLCFFLAKKNYNLILVSKTLEKLIDLKQKINAEYNINIDICSINFDSENNFAELIKIYKRTDKINGLVLMPPKIQPTNNCLPDSSDWCNIFNKTFVQPLELIKYTLPFLKKETKSKVVIISGISSVQALPNYSMNNVIRTAWLGQAKTLALFYGDQGIHFNTLSLGGILTLPFLKKAESEAKEANKSIDEILASKVDNVPLKKYASLGEVIVVIESMLSEFTDHITGSNIICDGGFIRAY